MRIQSWLIVMLVVAGNLLIWTGLNRPVNEVPFSGVVKGVSFSPFHANQDPLAGRFPSTAEIEQDLRFLADKVSSVRTYTALDGFEQVPALAAKHGLKVTAGAWLDHRLARNNDEVTNLIRSVRVARNVDRVIVGNESLLRGDLTVDQLVAYLKKVRQSVKLPISTAEPWHVWIKHPELAAQVDFIAIHILPYWEGISASDALEFVKARYRDVQLAFPGKPILIAEVGWPSGGNRVKWSKPTPVSQAQFIRQFLNLAQTQGYDYFVMEAFDQPWKKQIEGRAGPHWGLFDVERQRKFSMHDPLNADPWWTAQAWTASAAAAALIIWFLAHTRPWRWHGKLFFAVLIQMATSALAWTALAPLTHQLDGAGQLVWVALLPAQILLLLVLLGNGFEVSELRWVKQLRRRFVPTSSDYPTAFLPKVSIHLPICKEPPEVVRQTLESLVRLDYPDFEVIVVDNNTDDETLWRPVAHLCRTLGPRFRFYSLGKWPGYKAGALNFALRETAPDAEFIAVLDSDYVVAPHWLRATVPHFTDAKVGFVQAPQDNREWEHDRFREMLNWEYAGFFHVGMVHRNERNAIIQHGTMTIIRKNALETDGGWSEWCICEDAELGLRLMARGYKSVYVNEILGRGITPHTFTGYKNQRFRWVYGAIQILKRHWRTLLPFGRGTQLTTAQRFHFISGWLPWFADALHLFFTLAALLWTIGLLAWPGEFDFPLSVFLLPALGMFALKVSFTLTAYRSHVPCSRKQRWLASIAGMALTHVIARGVLQGIFTNGLPFLRTPKAENQPALLRGLAMAREETHLALALWIAAACVGLRYGRTNVDAVLWALVMAVQSLPYLAAVVTAMINVIPAIRYTTTSVPAEATPRVLPAPLTLQPNLPIEVNVAEKESPRRAA